MKQTSLFILILIIFSSSIFADEGMWQLSQLPKLKLEKKGLKMQTGDIYNPEGGGLTDAILSLGGCSASFVSENGLIATNHHCAYGAISRNSTPDNNILANGFLAKNFSEELPTETKITVLYRYKDVTDEVKEAVADISDPRDRYKAIDRKTKQIVLDAEKAPYTKARVASMNGGQQYVLFISKEIQDVRLVYNPAASIGKYGGDIDNWMWPRHTGDWSFLRAYVDKDGNPAPYNKENVPYEPEHYLKVSAKGIQDGDFNMIIGFPGRTMRYKTALEVSSTLDNNYKKTIKIMKGLIDIIDGARKNDPQANLKYAPISAGINNYYKNTQGMIDGLTKSKLADRKKVEEKKLLTWIDENNDRKDKYGNPVTEIDNIVTEMQKTADKRAIGRWMMWVNSVMSRSASIIRWGQEKSKNDIERKRGYMDRDLPRLKRRLETMERGFLSEVDQQILEYFLNLAFDLPEDQRIPAVEQFVISRENIHKFVTDLYDGTKITDKETRMIYFDMSSDELKQTMDPALEFAKALVTEADQYEEMDETNDGKLQQLRPAFIGAIAAMKGMPLYPDANSTIRLTYGYIKGYSPRDAVNYNWYTTANGIAEKFTGEEPFNAPKKLLDLIAKKEWGDFEDSQEKTLMVDFLNTCDITGGNSGSAVMNAEGELIGLAFDGDYEAMTSDWQFTPAFSRTIAVDIRYALWVMKYVDNAENLLDEMDIVD